jgi:hypothetical protein
MLHQTALLPKLSLVLGTWYSAFENIEPNRSFQKLQFSPWYLVPLLLAISKQIALFTNLRLVLGTWYLCFWEYQSKLRSSPTSVWYLVPGSRLSLLSKQTALLAYFSQVLGTWYSAFWNVKANCTLDQLQFDTWYLVLCFWEYQSKLPT